MNEILISILKECEYHKEMIEWDLQNLKKIFPLSKNRFENMNLEEKSILDSLIFRFAKLQDTISQKLFKTILLLLEEDVETLAFIDVLNKLEKLRIIEEVEQWKQLRKIRNLVVHEYNINRLLLVDELNQFYESVNLLIDIYEKLKKYIYKRFEN